MSYEGHFSIHVSADRIRTLSAKTISVTYSSLLYKQTIPKTLNPQWREQFDLHLYDEEGGILEISVWDKDIGRRDDFIGQCVQFPTHHLFTLSVYLLPGNQTHQYAIARCLIYKKCMCLTYLRCLLDLSTLSREKTHKLELELEEDKGSLVLLVTLTATVTVSISDLSVNLLNDPHERQQIMKRYVSVTSSQPNRIFSSQKGSLTLLTANLSSSRGRLTTISSIELHSNLSMLFIVFAIYK